MWVGVTLRCVCGRISPGADCNDILTGDMFVAVPTPPLHPRNPERGSDGELGRQMYYGEESWIWKPRVRFGGWRKR